MKAISPNATDSAEFTEPATHRRVPSWLCCVLPLADFLLLLAAYHLAALLRLDPSAFREFGRETFPSALLYAGAVTTVAAIGGAYRKPNDQRRLSSMANLILDAVVGTLAALFIIYVVFVGSPQVGRESRAVLLLATLGFLPPAMLVRELLWRRLEKAAKDQPFLVVGSPEAYAQFLAEYKNTGLRNPLVSFNPRRDHADTGLETPIWAKVGRVGDPLRFDTVILAEPTALYPPELLDWLARVHFSKAPVLSMNAFFARMWRKVPILSINPEWVFEQDFSLAERSVFRLVKRGFDLLVSIIFLVPATPLILLLAILVRFDSKGPVFFRQRRIGRNRVPFTILKFRTMRTGSEQGDPYTAAGDQRMTRVGRWMRVLRLDEIPQVFNVLSGEMSLIGPRPEWDRLVPEYERQIPFYHLRHLVKPGITGWAQLNHSYGEGVRDAEEKLRYDLYYIRHYSPVLDLEILLKTILHMISLKGR